jgi:small subunit ribosomal protein S1
MDRCHNCIAKVLSEVQFLDWEAICPECGHLTWLASGENVQCTVVRLHPFGIFVVLGDQVEGRIHISELTSRQIQHPSEVVREGDLVTAKVLHIELADRKIGLSLKRVPGN